VKGHGAKFPNRFKLAIATLLEQGSWRDAARAVGVAESTLWRWGQREDFRRAYREANERIVEEAIAKLQKASGGAVDTLQTIMSDSEKPPTARVTAARSILDLSFKAVEMENVIARIENIERLLEIRKGEGCNGKLARKA